MRILDRWTPLTAPNLPCCYRAATTADAAEVEALTKPAPGLARRMTEIKAADARPPARNQVQLGNLDGHLQAQQGGHRTRTRSCETEQTNDKAASAARALRIKGDQYKTVDWWMP